MPPRRRDNSRDSYRRRDRRDDRRDDRRGDRDDRRGDRDDRRGDRDDLRDDRRDRDRGGDRDRDDRRGGRRYRDRSDRNDSLDRDRNARRNRERDNRDRERESRNRDRERRPRWDVREKSPVQKRHAREFSDDDSDEEEEKKDVPNFESGVLSGGGQDKKKDELASVEVRDITYSEPVDAGEPPQSNPFNLFLFEPGQDDPIEKLVLDKRGFYRFGRDSQLNDVPLHELSCSKVHAALQFRKIENVNDEGETSFQTNLYVIDLDSTNGTFINDKQIPTSRYVQVLPKDVLSFGDLSTDYVVVREDEKKEQQG
ncbi:SMAD/FHA domain-containing protein [Yarrowia lipolytica]|uniref:YALI0D07348p n=2 Tax=Yarrowia lipolytica TaxID=4952 RepID=Q6C9Y5_YARLI|nr:YALI0D07348p [Yarrowia lipolytica CLIB122]AOW03723.1 hypothetical protein YALI1_D09404g [Yarrowia lipolytica]KAB8284366.1 SMAD/FHA domain-containing protein [Yarrowia lipolytica]KAE8172658.1 SMAD/FHA domain-containing protein [Yarrowia lipolytica]KAJ8054682.1 SMAD/FHA domain-containing protein [Yarrowia lipolytica]RDW26414.1 SMAD/FHA domain-containing protein [Yarrowia lipolytica]|eukprot:XP_502527.1 YALI0D07348p [Yarrowia lipolytica CLIB122]